MNLLAVIDLLCDITTRQSDLLKEIVTEMEHTRQVSEEIKTYYREAFENIEKDLDISECRLRDVNMSNAHPAGTPGGFLNNEES
ncbi:MAG: hypothetical protein LUG91_09955 [Ruminococcus sp.]|nr:hypothetical protein [Ruminococcus sp.]